MEINRIKTYHLGLKIIFIRLSMIFLLSCCVIYFVDGQTNPTKKHTYPQKKTTPQTTKTQTPSKKPYTTPQTKKPQSPVKPKPTAPTETKTTTP